MAILAVTASCIVVAPQVGVPAWLVFNLCHRATAKTRSMCAHTPGGILLPVVLVLLAHVVRSALSEAGAESDDDVTVFVNADLLQGRDDPRHQTVTEKVGVISWEECASACSEHTCCAGFVFEPAVEARVFGSCRLVEGAELQPPVPSHLRVGATSGILRRPAPAECRPAAATYTDGLGGTPTLMTALLVEPAGQADGPTGTISEDSYWGLVSILELQTPLVLVTHSALLPRLVHLLHTKVRVVLVQLRRGALQPDPGAEETQERGRQHWMGSDDQEPLDMFPYTEEWEHIHREFEADAAHGSCGLLQRHESQSWISMQVGLNKMIWLSWAARVNPFESSAFLWLDMEPCAHLLSGPLNLRFLHDGIILNKVFTFASSGGSRSSCLGFLQHLVHEQNRNTSNALIRSEAFGGDARALARASMMYLEAFRRTLDEGRALHGWQVLSLMHMQVPQLFYTIASDANIQHIDMAESACWSLSVLSSSAPRFRIAWPPLQGRIAPEEAGVVLETEKVLRSDEGKLAMFNQHRYPLSPGELGSEVTAQIQICAHISAHGAHAPSPCSMSRHAFAGKEKSGDADHHVCSVAFRCGDIEPLWLGELQDGEYTMEVQLQTMLGFPISTSQKTTFHVRREGDWRNAPAGLRAAPALESILDLPLLLSAQGVCEDSSFRARCRYTSHAKTNGGKLRYKDMCVCSF